MTESKDMSGDLSQFRKIDDSEKANGKLQHARLKPEESMQLHADLFEHAPVAYFVFNRKGLLEKVNQTGARMLGCEKHDIEAKSILSCFAKGSHVKFFDHIAGVSVMRKKQACHLDLLRADGTAFKAHFVTSPVTNAEGDFVHYRTIAVDISGQK
jgi:PAS domain S-box-containing protein